MFSHSGKRSDDAQAMLDMAKHTEWGLLILDEVHMAAATTFLFDNVHIAFVICAVAACLPLIVCICDEISRGRLIHAYRGFM